MSEQPVVIDASVAICLLLGEAQAPIVAQAFDLWASEERPLVVPAHFWLEVVNRLSREPMMTGVDVLASIHRLDTFEVETFELGRPILLHVIDRVERFRLTAYDSMYLATAEYLDAELATLDRALIAAAGRRAITFSDGHRLHEPPAVYEQDVTWPRYKEASAYLAKLRSDTLAGRAAYERPSPSAVPGPRR